MTRSQAAAGLRRNKSRFLPATLPGRDPSNMKQRLAIEFTPVVEEIVSLKVRSRPTTDTKPETSNLQVIDLDTSAAKPTRKAAPANSANSSSSNPLLLES